MWPRTGLRFAAQLDLSFSWLLTFFVAQQILSHQFPRQDRTRQVVAGVGWGGRQRQWGPNTILPEGEPDCRLPELDEKQLEGFKKKGNSVLLCEDPCHQAQIHTCSQDNQNGFFSA